MRSETEIVEGVLRSDPAFADARIRVERHIVEGAYVATIVAVERPEGPRSAVLCSRLANGRIEEMRIFYGAKGAKR